MKQPKARGSRPASIIAGELKCEYSVDPIGVGEENPRLSWKVLAAGKDALRGLSQSAYQIRVAGDRASLLRGGADWWDSGKVESSESVFIEYAGKPIASGQRAYWTVRVWDQDGRASDEVKPAFWEKGIAQSEWQGQWIGSRIVGGLKTEVPVPFLRKSFALPAGKKIAWARLYATALGVYDFHLNGRKVGDHVFAPFWTDYRKRVQYQVHDVTDMLTAGKENVAGAILGDGWYCGYTGNIQKRQFYGDCPRLLAQIAVRFTDGSTQTIATDGSWFTAIGPIIGSDMFMGENYDARLEMPGWDSPGFTADDRWSEVKVFESPKIEIVAMSGPPVREIRRIKPIAPPTLHTHWTGKTAIFDLGQNMVGRMRVKVKGPAGTIVVLKFAEVLDKDGKLYTANLRSARQIDTYTLRGEAAGEVYEPRFTFHGFRYVELGGFVEELAPDCVTGILLHSDMEQTGSFECSDKLVNQLQHNIEWGQRGNFLDVPTDCPQRDERLGWTGDAQVFVRTAAFNFDVLGFFAKWTQDLRDAQGALGSYPWIMPNNAVPEVKDGIEHNGDGGPAWADAGIICPWTMLRCFGDRRLIERHYASMVRFFENMMKYAGKFGLIRSHPEWNGWHGFGDWLSQDGKDGAFGQTPKDLIGTAFLAHDAQLLAQIARTLGKEAEAKKFDKHFEDVAAAFRRRFVTPDGLIAGHTQTSYVLALHFDLLLPKQRQAAVDALVRNIKNNGNKLNTGFVGSPYLNHVLTKAGRLDVAYELLMQQNWPSWLYAPAHGATTIWERWDGWTHDKGFQDPGMNSFNHYAYGAIGDWLYQVVAGLDLDAEKSGYAHIAFRPHPKVGGPLTYARASVKTIHGQVESGWKLAVNKLAYEVLVPPNTTATAYIPAENPSAVKESGKPLSKAAGVEVLAAEQDRAVVRLGSGRYRFESTLARA